MGPRGAIPLVVDCLCLLGLWVQVGGVTEQEVKELQGVFGEIERENTRLVAECDFLRRENSHLWSEVNRVALEVKELQQYTRVDNIEIAGIPQRSDEDIYELLEKVSHVLGTPYNRDDISEAHRLPKGNQGHPFIVVRFVSRRVRDQWLSAARGKPCNLQQIYPDCPDAPFYVNQHLTSYKKGLLDMAKRLVTEGVYQYAWVKDGKVYVRRTQTSGVIRIRNFEDFDQSASAGAGGGERTNVTFPIVF